MLVVQALEVDSQGLKKPLSSWMVPEEQLRRNWRSGLLTTGYFVVLPWQNPPTSEKLRVVARFTLADGRLFEADKDVTIHLPAALHQRTIPGGSVIPHDGPPLPPPAPAGPECDAVRRAGQHHAIPKPAANITRPVPGAGSAQQDGINQ